MTVEQFTQAYHAEPFIPFTLHLRDGRAFRVDDRSCTCRSQSGRFIVVATEGEGYARFEREQVATVEFHGPPPTGASA